jgi:chorismate dehydratase
MPDPASQSPGDAPAPTVRLACVRYLNTAPLVEGLEKVAGVELIPAVPSSIAGLVASGAADVGLVSVVDAARSPEPLAMLPCGMIGCDGPTLTVRVFSAVPFERAARLHADTDSHTSVALARVLLERRFGARPHVVPFDARERVERSPGAGASAAPAPAPPSAPPPAASLDDWPETVLLIGDKVVTDPPPAQRYPHQLDLGQAWREWTGLPFVYAVWMCRAERARDAAIASAAALLERQRLRNRSRLGWVAGVRAPEHRWPLDVATRYLSDLLRYEVGPREREAVARFLREAAAVGAAPPVEARWVDGVAG